MKTHAADRTRSPKWRAGSRRNKKIKNVKRFRSDGWKWSRTVITAEKIVTGTISATEVREFKYGKDVKIFTKADFPTTHPI